MEESIRKIHLSIGGMTCVNCQSRIAKKLNRTAGILSAGVSYEGGFAEIVYDEKRITREEISAVIEQLGYRVLSKGQKGPGMRKTVCILGVVILLYAILQFTGLLNLLVPGQLADTKMGYGMLFVIGLITSVHCIAMCGGINISQCVPRPGQSEEDRSGWTVFRPALAYNLGRVLSYTGIGLILGMAGSLLGAVGLGVSALLQGILKIAAGLLMIIMGINMLGLFLRLRRFTVRMPKGLARKISRKRAESRRPLVVGILNGFMPCGPLQTMWLVALAAGNPLAGALSMFLFGLGTVPLMLTARTQEEDVIYGLQIGADDYMTKPFSLKELYARMTVIWRRVSDELKPLAEKFSWNDNDLYIDFEHSEICKKGEPTALTPSEWKILSALIRHPQKVFTRSELIELVFGPDFDGYERVIDTHIKNLRKKVESDPKKPVYVKTVHGLGYKFGGEER